MKPPYRREARTTAGHRITCLLQELLMLYDEALGIAALLGDMDRMLQYLGRREELKLLLARGGCG